MDFNIRQMGAGIGILLYGMHNFEQALNYLGGARLKQLLQSQTKNRRRAMFTGMRTTTILQSSTLVSLLVLAFTGAGIMQLQNAIGVILGANVGSPMLPFFAALLGFSEFDIGAVAYPLIAIGALILMFIKNNRRLWYAKLIIGFGLFFVGIGMMKESVEALKASFDIESFAHLSLRGFGLLGVIFSALMSSSGALGIITITAVGGGIITFPASIAIMIGANIGTTWTAFLASLGGNVPARQVAMSHVLFNVLSTVLGVVFFRQYIWVGNNIFGLEHNPALNNAVIAIVYNLSSGILFCIFIKPFTALVKLCVPERQKKENILQVDSLGKVDTNSFFNEPELLALTEDCKTLVQQTDRYTGFIFGITPEIVNSSVIDAKMLAKSALNKRDKERHIQLYNETIESANKMLGVVIPLKQTKLREDSAIQLHAVETTIYSCLKSIKAIKNIHHDLIDFAGSINEFSHKLYTATIEAQIEVRKCLYQVQVAPTAYKYQALLLAHKQLLNFHEFFLKEIGFLPVDQANNDIPLTAFINIDHYVYESLETTMIAYAHTYLTPHEVEDFEKTQDIDKEIYESFSLDTK